MAVAVTAEAKVGADPAVAVADAEEAVVELAPSSKWNSTVSTRTTTEKFLSPSTLPPVEADPEAAEVAVAATPTPALAKLEGRSPFPISSQQTRAQTAQLLVCAHFTVPLAKSGPLII